MSAVVLVDTDILIDAGRRIDEAVERLDALEQHSTLAISTITEMELLVGGRSRAE